MVCAILSIFHESQRWNRENLNGYREIYLDVSMDTLRRRDFRGLYERAFNGEEQDVVGVDMEFPPPYAPDLVINNDQDYADLAAMAMEALDELGIDAGPRYRYSQRNLLAAPEKYEYSQYQGARFLESYQNSRERSIARIEDRMDRIERVYGGDRIPHPWTEPFGLSQRAGGFLTKEIPVDGTDPGSADEPSTREFLRRSIDSAIAGEQVADGPLFQRLLQRFEVSKKVYTRYGMPDLRPGKGSSKDLLNYGMFGALLGLAGARGAPEQRLIAMNSLLKINDILESQIANLCTPAEHLLALASMKRERQLFQDLRLQAA